MASADVYGLGASSASHEYIVQVYMYLPYAFIFSTYSILLHMIYIYMISMYMHIYRRLSSARQIRGWRAGCWLHGSIRRSMLIKA
jgi:hypothetical protein